MLKTLRLPKLIRRLPVGVALATLLIGAMTSGVAAASGSSRQPVPPVVGPPFPCPTYSMLFTLKLWNEYVTTTVHPDGTIDYFYSGAILDTVTNETTGNSMLLNLSGNGKFTTYPDGTATFIGQGPNMVGLGNTPPSNFGLPALFVVVGRVQLTYDSSGNATSFFYTGQLIDLCAALS